MLDGNNSFEQSPPIDNSFDSTRYQQRALINNSIGNSLTKPNPLTLSHDEPRKRPGRPMSMQSVITPMQSQRKSMRPTSGGLNKSTYMRNTSAFSVIQNDIATGRSKFIFSLSNSNVLVGVFGSGQKQQISV